MGLLGRHRPRRLRSSSQRLNFGKKHQGILQIPPPPPPVLLLLLILFVKRAIKLYNSKRKKMLKMMIISLEMDFFEDGCVKHEVLCEKGADHGRSKK